MNAPLQTAAVSMFRPRRGHGDPHPSNGRTDRPEEQGFYFCIDSRDFAMGHLAGYVTAEQFDWLAERLNLPKLSERSKP